jgi:3-hydroxybutyryl-CoA dehydrogenase
LPETIAIIGAGPLGRWLALAAARGGFRVLLEDVMPSNLHHAREWLRQEFGPHALVNARSEGVAFVSTIEDAVREADLAIDCVPDELESTPTTRLSISDLASCTYRPDRCVAIVAEAASLAEGASRKILMRTTSKTSAETMELLTRFWNRLGFTPAFEPDPAEIANSGHR